MTARPIDLTTALPSELKTQATPLMLRPAFPFSALVGQTALQQALLLAAIDPGIGGVLISGPRGTAKSTAARALAALLPEAPFVTLPLAASLEQVVGTLDLEGVLQDGRVRLAPGLVAQAHLGVLYVDEVNLLPDALVDALLDVAASGVNTVARDGITQQHAARFVLIGTMNPEEGELRPQLQDRFGLSVQLNNPADAAERIAIVRARLGFDEQPQQWAQQHADEQARLTEAIQSARAALPLLSWSDAVLERAAQHALAAAVDGVRADLVMLRAARALAALAGRSELTPADVDAVAELALVHRRSSSTAAPPKSAPPSAAANPNPNLTAAPAAGGAAGRDPTPQGDWGALAARPEGTTRVLNSGAWPTKKV